MTLQGYQIALNYVLGIQIWGKHLPTYMLEAQLKAITKHNNFLEAQIQAPEKFLKHNKCFIVQMNK